jgi:hypothetical protein
MNAEVIETIHVEKLLVHWFAYAGKVGTNWKSAFGGDRLDAVSRLVDKFLRSGIPLAESVGIHTWRHRRV